MSKKDVGLIKGALRRVFSRSDFRRAVLLQKKRHKIDTTRPRVKNWSECNLCKQLVPTYTVQVDHISPVVPIGKAFEELDLNEFVDSLWCEENNLQVLCKPCHDTKSKLERKERKNVAKPSKRVKKANKKRSSRASS